MTAIHVQSITDSHYHFSLSLTFRVWPNPWLFPLAISNTHYCQQLIPQVQSVLCSNLSPVCRQSHSFTAIESQSQCPNLILPVLVHDSNLKLPATSLPISTIYLWHCCPLRLYKYVVWMTLFHKIRWNPGSKILLHFLKLTFHEISFIKRNV